MTETYIFDVSSISSSIYETVCRPPEKKNEKKMLKDIGDARERCTEKGCTSEYTLERVNMTATSSHNTNKYNVKSPQHQNKTAVVYFCQKRTEYIEENC